MRYIYFILFALFASPAIAADVNGYTAQYECKSGGTNCNVDVATLTAQACQQTITTATTPTGDWSAINWSNTVICIQAGDHTGRGTLTIGASGTSGTRKVLRYYRSSDTDDEPWNQSDANKAKIDQLIVRGKDYWIINRLSFPVTTSVSTARVDIDSDGADEATNLILNRIHIVGGGFGGTLYYGVSISAGTDITLQNSVVGEFYGNGPIAEAVGVSASTGTNIRLVNNEIYDYAAHPIQIGDNNGPTMPGFVIENNDVFQSTAMQTTGGTLTRGEDPVSIKAGATSGNPAQIIHNRIWGARVTDLDYCCNGTYGSAIGINQLPVDEVFPEGGYSSSGSYKYTLIKNNIVFDSQWGITWYPSGATNTSIIGNIFYKIREYDSSVASYALIPKSSSSEIYLNTFVYNETYSIDVDNGELTNDLRCNAFLSGAAAVVSGTPPASIIADFNAFYDTTLFTFNGTATNINKTVSTRANSTAYSLNAIIRTTATPPADGTSGDFLYMVTTAGTSAGSPPAYTTTLGGTTTDGTMVVKAIRGPYSFYRKLRTTAELVYIPYATVHSSSPDYQYCPNTTGNRTSIGVSDQTGTW